MKMTVKNFIQFWNERYSYISLELTDEEIRGFLLRSTSLEMACDFASDYLLSQGLAEVQE